jgi:hypothetical protein
LALVEIAAKQERRISELEATLPPRRAKTAAPSKIADVGTAVRWRKTPDSPPFSHDRSPLDGPARSQVIHRMWGLIHSRTLDAVVENALVREQLTCQANGNPNGEVR